MISTRTESLFDMFADISSSFGQLLPTILLCLLATHVNQVEAGGGSGLLIGLANVRGDGAIIKKLQLNLKMDDAKLYNPHPA